MSRHPLTPHATSPQTAAERLVVEVARGEQDCLQLNFRLSGDIGALVLPAPAASVRADGLWRHTCFEAFVAAAGPREYWEFNFSPSGAWAAYHFTGYRAGMAPLVEAGAPRRHPVKPARPISRSRRRWISAGWCVRMLAADCVSV